MTALLATFGPISKETAIFLLAAVICFGVAALVGPISARFPGGAIGLVALGLGLWLFPAMWNTMTAAF